MVNVTVGILCFYVKGIVCNYGEYFVRYRLRSYSYFSILPEVLKVLSATMENILSDTG